MDSAGLHRFYRTVTRNFIRSANRSAMPFCTCAISWNRAGWNLSFCNRIGWEKFESHHCSYLFIKCHCWSYLYAWLSASNFIKVNTYLCIWPWMESLVRVYQQTLRLWCNFLVLGVCTILCRHHQLGHRSWYPLCWVLQLKVPTHRSLYVNERLKQRCVANPLRRFKISRTHQSIIIT